MRTINPPFAINPPCFRSSDSGDIRIWAILGSAAFGGRKFCYFGVSVQGDLDDFRVCRLRRQKILLFWGLYTGGFERFLGLPPKAAENFAILGSLYRGKRAEGARKFWVLCSVQEAKSSKICQNSGPIPTSKKPPPLGSPDFGPKGGGS